RGLGLDSNVSLGAAGGSSNGDGRRPSGSSIPERHSAREVEAAHQDMGRVIEGAGGGDAKPMGHDPVGAEGSAEVAYPLLDKLVDGTPVLSARGEQALLAFEDHRQVCREGSAV